MKHLLLLALLTTPLLPLRAAPVPATKPNIVFILADDLGYGDLGCYNKDSKIPTPNLDRLAGEGTRFTDAHAPTSVCSPTRTGFMTAKFPATYPTYPANGGFANHVTVTELLKQQGYRTGHFGKWHIGPVQQPGTYGIDSIGAAEDEAGGKKKKGGDDRGRDAHIYDEAIRFIEKNKDGPFYVNVWGHVSHNPVNPTDALVKRWSNLKVKDQDFPAPMRAKLNPNSEAGAAQAAGGTGNLPVPAGYQPADPRPALRGQNVSRGHGERLRSSAGW